MTPRCSEKGAAGQWERAPSRRKKAPRPPVNWIPSSLREKRSHLTSHTGGTGAEAEAGKGISPVLPSGRESHLAQINGERNSKPPLPESEVVRYPVPANRPKGLTVSPSPNPHPSAAPNRKLGVGGASRPLVHHVHEAGAKVNIHRAPLTQQPTVPPAERKRKWVRTVTSGITLRSRNGGAWLPC